MARTPALPEGLRPSYMWRAADQRGTAVVAMLLVVAVVAVLAAALMARQASAIQSAQAEQTRVQARWLLQAEVSRAQAMLRAEAQREPSTRLDGLWRRRVAGEAVGTLEGAPARLFSEVVDEQSKFNLRNLVSAGQIDPEEADSFLRLCALVGVPPAQAQRIAQRVVTSLVEAEPRGDPAAARAGATTEEIKRVQAAAAQLGLPPQLPSRDHAPRLRALDDLLGQEGVERAAIDRLRPYVTVLPARARLNANTTSPEVLAATVPGLSMDRARALIRARDGGQWFLHRGDIFNRLQLRDRLRPSDLRVGVTSRWFLLSSAVQGSRATMVVHALLHDDKQQLPQVIWMREGV